MIKEYIGTGKTIEEATNAAKAGLRAPLSADIKIEVMDFVDDDKQLVFSPPELIREGCVTVG